MPYLLLQNAMSNPIFKDNENPKRAVIFLQKLVKFVFGRFDDVEPSLAASCGYVWLRRVQVCTKLTGKALKKAGVGYYPTGRQIVPS